MASIFRFDDFELDGGHFELRRAGVRVEVQPKVLRLLLYLVEHRERCVSADELLASLWPRERVTRSSVKRAIGGARQALGERSGPSRIRTVARHGYRFEADVHASAESAAPTRELATSALIGRASTMRALAGHLNEVLAGAGCGVYFSGEPGAGKTRLLRELAHTASVRGARVWFGRCSDLDGAPALWPLWQMVRQAVRELTAAELLDALGAGAADIARALPELHAALPQLQEPVEIGGTAERFRLFDAIAAFLQRVAHERPLVLAFDDLHLADPVTASLLAFLTRQLDRSPVLIAASMRALVGLPPERAQPLAALLRSPHVHCLELQGLTPSEIVEWASARAGVRLEAARARELHAQSGGNPLFLEHMLPDLQQLCAADAGRAPRSQLAWDRLRGPIERHLEQLPQRGLELLRCASLLGDEFTESLLADVAERSRSEVASELEAARQLGLTRTAGEAHHTFAHALIRDALMAQLTAADRARLHGRAGRALEALRPSSYEQLCAIAGHYVRAAPEHDQGRALPACREAARSARQRGAFEEASVYFEHALALATPELRLACLLEKGEAAADGGQAHAAREALLAAASEAYVRQDPDAAVRAALALGELPESGSVDVECVAAIERAIELVDPAEHSHACLRALLAKRLMYARDRAHCTQLARGALRDSAGIAAPLLRARSLRACLHALAEPACRDERLAASTQLERLGHEHGDPRSLISATSARVQAAVEIGDLASVDAAIETLESVAHRARDPIARWHAETFRAMAELLRGQLPRAVALARGAFQRGRRLDQASAEHVYVTQLSSVLRLQGRMRLTERVVRYIALRHPSIAGWQAVLSTIEAQRGRTQHARAVLERLVERDLESLRSDPFGLSVLAAGADLCALVGEREHAAALSKALEPYAALHGCIGLGAASHGPLSRHLGRLALQRGELEEAERFLQAAMASAQRMGSPQYICASQLNYAQLLLTAGDVGNAERALKLVASSTALADAHGMYGFRPITSVLLERSQRRRSRSA